MFVRLAVLLIAAVAATVIGWRVYLKVILPNIHARRVERLRRENEELDRIIKQRSRRRR